MMTPMASRPRIPLARLVDLAARLRRDQARPERELRDRDAEVGRNLAPPPADEARLLAAWLDRVSDDDPPGHRAAAAVRTGMGLLVLLGLALGWAAAAGVFRYDGTRPVNAVHVVAVFVFLPVVLLVVIMAAAAAGRGPVGETLRGLSPGRLMAVAVRLLPRRYREAADALLGGGASPPHAAAALGGVHKWLILAGSQAFAVAFFLGGVIGAAHLIVFTDLAFGWSTTLDAGANELVAVTHTLALPWGWAWGEAVPSRDTIEATRFRRGVDAITASPAWRDWWPFLLMAMIVYGLLPRIACLVFAARRLSKAVARAFARYPGTAVVLDRLAPVTRVSVAGVGAAPAEAACETTPAPPAADDPPAGVAVTIDWADAAPDESAFHAGGARSLDDDRGTLAAAAERARDRDGRVVVCVRGWEPPMLDAMDFLGELRDALDDSRLIEVRPVGGDAARAAEWDRRCRKLGDPRLIVRREQGGNHD